MPPSCSIYSSIDSLKQALNVRPVNTGRVYEWRGIVFDDRECLRSIVDPNGYVQIRSGIEMDMFMYRGQTEEYNPCVPTIGRVRKTEEQFLSFCRNAAFEEAIGEHPYVRVAEKTLFLGNPLNIDKQGIAQHYGLCTDRIDLTSNFDVASFFATCKWDKEQNRFIPIKSSSKLGVIYRVLHVFMMGNVQTKEGESAFSFVGWQPLPRPEQQRAGSLRMEKGEDFIHIPTVQRYYFQHDGAISERIWNEFEQGRTLFPEDKAAILANKAEKLMGFTRDQIDRAWSKLEFWHRMKCEDDTRYRIESRTGIEVVKRSQLDWEDVGLEKDENYWLQKLKKNLGRVRFRRCYAG